MKYEFGAEQTLPNLLLCATESAPTKTIATPSLVVEVVLLLEKESEPMIEEVGLAEAKKSRKVVEVLATGDPQSKKRDKLKERSKKTRLNRLSKLRKLHLPMKRPSLNRNRNLKTTPCPTKSTSKSRRRSNKVAFLLQSRNVKSRTNSETSNRRRRMTMKTFSSWVVASKRSQKLRPKKRNRHSISTSKSPSLVSMNERVDVEEEVVVDEVGTAKILAVVEEAGVNEALDAEAAALLEDPDAALAVEDADEADSTCKMNRPFLHCRRQRINRNRGY